MHRREGAPKERSSNQGGFCTAPRFQWGYKDVPFQDILSQDISSWEQSAQLDPLARATEAAAGVSSSRGNIQPRASAFDGNLQQSEIVGSAGASLPACCLRLRLVGGA